MRIVVIGGSGLIGSQLKENEFRVSDVPPGSVLLMGNVAVFSYLQVLDAERGLFQSELELAALRRHELASIVELYRALGGGWTPAQPEGR